MKVLNLHTYDEKLKINPIGLNDFNQININVDYKSKLKQYDIVKCDDFLYMFFIGRDVLKCYINFVSFLDYDKIEKEGIFYYYSKKHGHVYLFVYEYEKSLKRKRNHKEYDISDLYKAPEGFIPDMNMLSQDDLQDYIDIKNFEHIQLR